MKLTIRKILNDNWIKFIEVFDMSFLKKAKKKAEEATKKGLEVGEKGVKKGVKVGKKAGEKGIELGKKGVKKTKEAVD